MELLLFVDNSTTMITLVLLSLMGFFPALQLDDRTAMFNNENSKEIVAGGGEKVVLSPKKSVEEQLNQASTIYEVRYDFDLRGKAINIPPDSELIFEGGAFRNGVLVGQNTIVSSPPRKCFGEKIVFKGTWRSPFYMPWICQANKNEDLGLALNTVQEAFKHIIIPQGEYAIKSAATLFDVQLDWYGIVYYRGTATAIDVITLSSVSSLNMTGSLSGRGSIVRGGNSKRTNIHGLVIKNCANSKFNIGHIDWFNVGLEVVGDDAACAYNTFNLSSIRNCNINLLVTQRKMNKSIGYANENLFIGGRFGRSSDWKKTYGTEGNINIACKTDHYKDDVYKSVNSLTFIKQCLEDEENTYAIVLDNATRCSFTDIRLEGNNKDNVKLNGSCGELYFSSSYGHLSFDLTDLTVRDNLPLFSNRFIAENCMPLTYQLCAEDILEGSKKGESIELNRRYINYTSSKLAVNTSNRLSKNCDGNYGNMGFRICFDNVPSQQQYIRVIVHKKGDARTNVYCKATEAIPGGAIKNQEKDAFYRVVALSYNGHYDRWSSGTNVQDVLLWPKGNVKEVTFMLDNAYSATIVTTGYLAPAL